MVKIRPLNDRVLIKPAETKDEKSGGIIIPDTAKEKPQEGKVMAIGDSDELTVKVGDNVIYSKYAGTEIKFGGAEYLIVREEDILGVLG
mgnify:CR=1 FL=1